MSTRLVAFDMDGTLVQTRAASWDVFQDTASRFGLSVRSAEEFFELFRDNFYVSLSKLCTSAEQEAEVRAHFLAGLRERYVPNFTPGMRDVVKALAARYPLAVLSSNAMAAIRRILEGEGVAECFAHVFSGEVGTSKEAVLLRLLAEPSYSHARHCEPSYVEGIGNDDFEVVLVTDTVGDAREASRCGVRVIGVAWGMHSRKALLAAGAETVALWPQELIPILLDPAAPEGDACACAGVIGTCACTCSSAEPPPTGVDLPIAAAGAVAAAAAAGRVRRERRCQSVPAQLVAAPVPASVAPERRRRRAGSDWALLAELRRISIPKITDLTGPAGSRRT